MAAYLDFDDISIGKNARNARYTIIKSSTLINEIWTPITREKLTFQTTNRNYSQVLKTYLLCSESIIE